MKKTKIIALIMLLGIIKIAIATDYNINPMNFPTDSARNHTITVSSPGDIINVTYPSDFSLVSGSSDGTNNISFVLESPSSSTNGDLYYMNISINNTFYDSLVTMSVPDNEIVDNKWELGHGDFNYPDCQYLPNQSSLVFPIIRIWGVGTDVLNEEAENVSFTCNYPKIRPRTVDSKFTTNYSNPSYLEADGFISEMEGFALFRIFVLSQEVDYNVGQNYEVTCTDLTYQFDHHTIQAEIPSINISIVDSNPFNISTITTSNYVEYIIENNQDYEIRDIEFEWKLNNLVHREEKSNMESGEIVKYRVWANNNPTIILQIRQKPCWMFNSRSPTYYDTTFVNSFSINSNATEVLSVEEKIFHKTLESVDLTGVNTQLQNISENLGDLIFLFKINTDQFQLTVERLPESQQNEANFTCFRLGLKSNGFNTNPEITIQTEAQESEDIIVKNELFQTMEYDFVVSPDGFGLVTWDTELGLCTEDTANNNFVCPTTYNYICLAEDVPEELAVKQEEVPLTGIDGIRQKVFNLGEIISPTYPFVGVLMIIAFILLLIFVYYYYSDEVSLKAWIQERKQKKEREEYLKWREKQQNQRRGMF